MMKRVEEAARAGALETTADFYVAPYGDDSNPGTKQKPFATLSRARDAIRELKKKRPKGDITVRIRGGTYRFTETVVFGLEDSGSEDQVITYAAYTGERPIFTSGVHVTGWQPITSSDPGWDYLPPSARNKVYVADIPGGLVLIRNLVDRNENWLERARMDVTSDLDTTWDAHPAEMWDSPEEKNRIEFYRSMERLSNADSALDLRIYPTTFNMNLLPVDSIHDNQLRTIVPGTYRLTPTGEEEWNEVYELCWIENLLEGLDEPGKWVCNTKTNKVYLWPKSGTSNIYAPRLIELIRVEGDIDYWGPTDDPVRYINFEGITFTNGDRAEWEEGDAGIQHDWGMADKSNALLRFRGAENCTVENCTFKKSGGVGVRFDLHAQNNTVSNCLFEYLGYEAIQFCGYGIGKKDVNKNNKFVHNEIHHIGQIKWDSPAIIVWNSGYNHIAHNYIHHCPNKAVLLSAPRNRAFTKDCPMREQAWGMARWDEVGDEAHANVIYNEWRVDVNDEVCAPYRYLRGNIVEKNILHDISEGMWGDIFYVTATASALNPPNDYNKIISNYIYNSDGCSKEQGRQKSSECGFFRGIHLDGFMGNVEVHKNVWYNCRMLYDGYRLALSYGEVYPRANMFYGVSRVEDYGAISLGEEGYGSSSGRRLEGVVYPRGNLLFDETDDPNHDPNVNCLDDYYNIYNFLDSLPVETPGVGEIKSALLQVIHELGKIGSWPEVKVTTDMEEYMHGEPGKAPVATLKAKLIATNQSARSIELPFRNTQRYDFVVRNNVREEVVRWSTGKLFTEVAGKEVIEPEGQLTYEESLLLGEIGKPLPERGYMLEGIITVDYSTKKLSDTTSFRIVPTEISKTGFIYKKRRAPGSGIEVVYYFLQTGEEFDYLLVPERRRYLGPDPSGDPYLEKHVGKYVKVTGIMWQREPRIIYYRKIVK